MKTHNDRWIAAFDQAIRTRGYLVTITTAPGVTHRWVSYDRIVFLSANMASPGVGSIESAAGARLDVIDRRRTIGDWEIIFMDDLTSGTASRIRELARTTMLRGKRLTVEIGTLELVEEDYEFAAANWIIRDVIPAAGMVRVIASDPGEFSADAETSKYKLPAHPLKIIEQHYADLNLSSLLGHPSFDEKLYTETSHFVVSRWPMNDQVFIYDPTLPGGWLSTPETDWVTLESIDQSRAEPEKVLDQIFALSELIYGGIDADPGGLLRFIGYDSGATSLKHFSAHEHADFEQHEINYQINQVTVTGRGFDGKPITHYDAHDAAAQALAGFPDTTGISVPKILEYLIPKNAGGAHPWLNGCQRGKGSDGFDDVATTLTIRIPRYFGFCGTTEEDALGNEVTLGPVTQQPEHQIDGVDRFGYFLLTDHVGKFEYVRATALSLSAAATNLRSVNGLKAFRLTGDYTVDRGWFGTTPQDWTDFYGETRFFIYDVTIAVWIATTLINRARLGVPECSISVSSRHADKQLGDPVSLDEARFLYYGIDGAGTNEVFEIVNIEPRPFEGQPGFRFRLALIRTGAVPPPATIEIDDPEIPIGTTSERQYYFDLTGAIYTDDAGEPYWSL